MYVLSVRSDHGKERSDWDHGYAKNYQNKPALYEIKNSNPRERKNTEKYLQSYKVQTKAQTCNNLEKHPHVLVQNTPETHYNNGYVSNI